VKTADGYEIRQYRPVWLSDQDVKRLGLKDGHALVSEIEEPNKLIVSKITETRQEPDANGQPVVRMFETKYSTTRDQVYDFDNVVRAHRNAKANFVVRRYAGVPVYGWAAIATGTVLLIRSLSKKGK
jgi:hypothetical protein